jgi:hypothetical protein
MIEQLIEKLAEQYPNSDHSMSVEDFAYWLQKNAPEAPRQNETLDVSAERNAMQRQRDSALSELKRECDNTDAALRILGLDPDVFRTDGGSLNLAKLHDSAAPLSPDHSGGAGEVVLPESCDAINAENAPTFMGEPNPHHSIDWYREGIAKHWKTICDQRQRLESLTAALTFYADREHYHFESGNWDTVSGEPLNILWCGDEPDFIEDGTVARTCLDKVKELNQ